MKYNTYHKYVSIHQTHTHKGYRIGRCVVGRFGQSKFSFVYVFFSNFYIMNTYDKYNKSIFILLNMQ